MTDKKSGEKDAAQNYQVLARRFRPQQFGEILGQEGIVSAITNAIRLAPNINRGFPSFCREQDSAAAWMMCENLPRGNAKERTSPRWSRMGGLLPEGRWLAGQDHGGGVQSQTVVGPTETLQEPAAKKAGAPRDKQTLSLDFLPQAGCVREDMIQVLV